MKKNKLLSFGLKLFELIQKHPGYTLFLVGIVFNIPFLFYDYFAGVNTIDFMVNIQSGVIEVFVLGFIIIGYEKLSAKKEAIERYEEEIISYLPWKEPEATHRIVGLIHSLNRLNVTNINLNEAHLEGADLKCVDLEGASLVGAHLKGAHLVGTHLEGAHFWTAHLEGADLMGAYLEGAIFWKAHLEGAHLEGAHLEGAILFMANLEGAHLMGTHLEGAHLEGAFVDGLGWIDRLKENYCTGVEQIEERYIVFEEVIIVEGVKKMVFSVKRKT
jgi:hypothetical protein